MEDEDEMMNEEVPAWCKEYHRSWEDMPENEREILEREYEKREQRRRKLALRAEGGSVRKGMMRHLMLVVDMSNKYLKQLHLYLEALIRDYFDQNPISQLGAIVTRYSKAELITELNGNPSRHIDQLKGQSVGGEPSLQNALQLARVSMSVLPDYGSKEVLVVYGSLSTTDPGDIHATIEDMEASNIRCSVVGWGAEVFILKQLTKKTGGTYAVALDEGHFQELLLDHSPPPPTLSSDQNVKSNLIRMGFPTKKTAEPSLCTCHKECHQVTYECPRCLSRWCSLPVDCTVCCLPLVASPHLARSYHHLFPLPQFETVSEAEGTACDGCLKPYTDAERQRYRCTHCNQRYCFDCDCFMHETLHNCPGCEASTAT